MSWREVIAQCPMNGKLVSLAFKWRELNFIQPLSTTELKTVWVHKTRPMFGNVSVKTPELRNWNYNREEDITLPMLHHKAMCGIVWSQQF